MEEGAPDLVSNEPPQEEKKTKVSSILRPGSMGEQFNLATYCMNIF